jgi:phosphoglucosamine mutase
MGRYFGTDGFRGRAGVTITAEQAFKIGAFVGWYFGKACGKKCRAVIGKDTRLSSYMLEYAIAAGLTAYGGDAYIMHVTTTPSISFVARSDGFDCGIMISASHNPFYDNGIKLLNGRGEKMDDEVISLIEDYLDGDLTLLGDPSFTMASGQNIGRTVDYVSGRNRYIGHLIALSVCSYKGIKVGLDCADGSSYKIAKSVFDALGAIVYATGVSPDGLNVNMGGGATNTERLVNLVKDNNLDVGFAFDGDADRCICVDEYGRVIDGDGILYALAVYLKAKGELPKDGVVATVMSNGGLTLSLKKHGINVILSNVGDRFVYEKMSAGGFALGGEQSGHVILSKLENTGDGLVTAIMLMEVMIECKLTASELIRGYARLPQRCISVKVTDKRAAMKDEEVARAISEIVGRLTGGRLIVRPSGTEEVIRIMAECGTEEECRQVCGEAAKAFAKFC